jgi:tmRNA-binding protein
LLNFQRISTIDGRSWPIATFAAVAQRRSVSVKRIALARGKKLQDKREAWRAHWCCSIRRADIKQELGGVVSHKQ